MDPFAYFIVLPPITNKRLRLVSGERRLIHWQLPLVVVDDD